MIPLNSFAVRRDGNRDRLEELRRANGTPLGKLDQYDARKVIHVEGVHSATIGHGDSKSVLRSFVLLDSASRPWPANASRIGEAARDELRHSVTTAHAVESWPRRFRIR